MHINMGSHEVWLDGIGIMGGCLSSHERSVGYAEISGHQSREELTGFFFFLFCFLKVAEFWTSFTWWQYDMTVASETEYNSGPCTAYTRPVCGAVYNSLN